MENVNTHIRMRDFPLDLLELMSLIWLECVCASLYVSACVYVVVDEKELNIQSSEWRKRKKACDYNKSYDLKMVMKAMGNLIFLKWTLSVQILRSYLTAQIHTCLRINTLVWCAESQHRTYCQHQMHSKLIIIFCGNYSVISGVWSREMYILISSEFITGNCNLLIHIHIESTSGRRPI